MALLQEAIEEASRMGARELAEPRIVVAFSVTVVDGSARDVAGEPVTAIFDLAAGDERRVTRPTDGHGAAQFLVDLPARPRGVVVVAGRESLGPFVPGIGDHLIIEM